MELSAGRKENIIQSSKGVRMTSSFLCLEYSAMKATFREQYVQNKYLITIITLFCKRSHFRIF